MQFNDEFVQKHYPNFDSAKDMRNSLIATTTMQRMKHTEEQAQVWWTQHVTQIPQLV